ncbi:MAG: MarR family winged helix-turn-helix transcriptional regulator [Bacillota bacterium]|nr:MarR family winged helix-turn-helix transcriptional regulator [Bacillota bacterium]
MNKIELRNALLISLQKMYDMDVFASMIEFCQGEMRVLIYLHMNNGTDIYPSDLSDSLCVTRQRITSILSSLRKKGYVSMKMAENDRRRMRVVLTEDGKNWLIKKVKEIEIYYDTLIDGLGENNIQEITRLMNMSIEQMEQFKNK